MKRAKTSQRPNRPPGCLRLQAAIALSLCRQNGDTCSLYDNVCSLCNTVKKDPLNFSYENPNSPSRRGRKVRGPDRQRKPLYAPSYRKLPTERKEKKKRRAGGVPAFHISTHFKAKRSEVSREIGKHGE